MSHYTDEPRFTIEQIDLLQRLRRTGMTKHEILHALETLERLDHEHGDKFGRRPAYSGMSTTTSTSNVAASSTITIATQTQYRRLSPSPSNSYDTSSPPISATANQNGKESMSTTPNGKLSPSRYPANSVGQRLYNFEATEEELDFDDKVEELMRRDSSIIKEEIKAFLANRRISQAVVAQVTDNSPCPSEYSCLLTPTGEYGCCPFPQVQQKVLNSKLPERFLNRYKTLSSLGSESRVIQEKRRELPSCRGISQSRISHWLLQQGSDLSEQKKRAFYRWYQLEKTSPGATLNMRPAPIAMEDPEWRQTPPPVSSTPGSFRLRRGSRFTWRKECLAVMDSTSHSDHQDPISLAVEMAAVNHTILALARQGGAGEIKTEVLDDDD
ncbi:UNVERIFIED_CONTAM: hypothetical protein FKN15_055734 [Acipenser sinensis]